MVGLLAQIMPISREVRGIESSTNAYYRASSAIEAALATMSIKNPGHSKSGTPNRSTLPESGASSGTGGYRIQETANFIPESGQGTSEHDSNWNALSPKNPIQLFIPASAASEFFDNFQLDLRVPKLVEGVTAP